jgi:hypothetical protein
MLAGPGTANAFATWTPAPTSPRTRSRVERCAACERAAAQPPPGAPSRGVTAETHVSLVDTRGPFTLVLFGASTATQGVLMCVSGPCITPGASKLAYEPVKW